ncbi:MAG TPA: hypothetical protein VHC71_00850 [Hyphomicrobium sp.]|nr:hypothetical protein [Hyphomicrobium sp.]
MAEIEADTKGMSEIERKEYFLRISQKSLATLHALKASKVLIEQADQHVARLTKELTELKARKAKND